MNPCTNGVTGWVCTGSKVTVSLFEMTLSSEIFLYYESIKREIKTKSMYECRCDERLKTKVGGIYTSRILWVARGNT
jgi:hypothetical protein